MSGTTETLRIRLTGDEKQAVAAMNHTVSSLSGLDRAFAKTSGALSKNQTAFQNWGRVIQDAPYGLIGIQNNLTQLIPSIGLLGLAFSALVAGVTFAQVGFGAWTKGMNGSKKATEEFNNELLETRKGAEQEISSMKALVSVAQNHALSSEKRKIAIQQLREQYPGYFKDLTIENSLTKNLTAVTNELTTAILKRAEARAREADISKKATKVFENQQKAEKIQLAINEKQAELRKIKIGSDGGSGRGLMSESERYASVQKDIDNLEKDRLKTNIETLKLQGEIYQSQTKVNELAAATISLDSQGIKKSKEKLTEAQKLAKFMSDFQAKMNSISFAESKDFIPIVDHPTTPQTRPNMIDGVPQTEAGLRAQQNKINLDRAEAESIGKKKDADAERNEQIAQAIALTNQLSDVFISSISSAETFGEVVGNVFKQLAVEIGKAALKAAIFSVVLGIVTGGGSAAAGSFGFGDLFKGFLGMGKMPWAADGGVFNGPQSGYLAMLHGKEAVFNEDQIKALGSGALAGRSANMSGMGPAEFPTYIGMQKIEGSTLKLWMQRSDFNLGMKR